MSPAEQDAAIGRMVQEKAEAEKVITLLTDRATRLGRKFKELGDSLVESPQEVTIGGESKNINFQRRDFPGDLFNAENLSSTCSDLREAILERDRLAAQLKKVGL